MPTPPPVRIASSRLAFAKWLANNPLPGDQPFAASGARYQVARYCDYLGDNPVPRGDPLRDASARDAAVSAYKAYLEVFAPRAEIAGILANLDLFYVCLGIGPVVARETSLAAPTPA